MEIEFKWIPPSKKNSKQVFCRWGRPTVIPSKAYQKWHGEMEDELWEVVLETWHPYVMTYNFFIPYNKDGSESKRPFDYSNKIESINDLLVDLEIIEDDNYYIIKEQHVFWEFVPYGEWKVIVTIK